MEENYLKAKRRLSDLQNELASLPRLLASAMEAGTTQEAIRLKGRQRDLPFEIEAQMISVTRAEIDYLEDLNAEARVELVKAIDKSKELDSFGAAALKVLNDERAKINNESLAALARKNQLASTIQSRDHRIRDTRRKLSELTNFYTR